MRGQSLIQYSPLTMKTCIQQVNVTHKLVAKLVLNMNVNGFFKGPREVNHRFSYCVEGGKTY
jgi:hypothetical protein